MRSEEVGDPQEQYELAKNAFYYQDYARTITLLSGLLSPMVLLATREQMLHAREMLAASMWWTGEKQGFREQFTRLLQDNPRFELDSFYYPPEMVVEFAELKKQLVEAKLLQIPEDVVERKRVTVEMLVYDHTPLALAFVPFGVGQFANGDEGMGYLFLGLEGGFLAANIASWSWLYFGNPHGVERTAGIWAMYGTFALLTGSAIWGIIHAVSNHRPERLLRQETMEREAGMEGGERGLDGGWWGFVPSFGVLGWETTF